MTLWLDDGDVRLYHGDALDVIRSLPDGSVDCCVTSPPYWGLRDYGTGSWEGGDPDCDHDQRRREFDPDSKSATDTGAARDSLAGRDTCRKCGGVRTDQQLGLEATPDEYVARMVAVFREVRRVLADHGTCWVNLGDSYAAARSYQVRDSKHTDVGNTMASEVPDGLKPKDLVGIPWRVAFALQTDGWYLRSDIVWAKPNPMPESVTDRPTKSHEYVFLLTKSPRYFFDQEAVREPHESTRWGGPVAQNTEDWKYRNGGELVGTRERDGREFYPNGGRNIRSVWNIATQPYPEAHFATFPEELARRCILAGCPVRVCDAIVCGSCGSAHSVISASILAGFVAGLEPPASIAATVQEELRHLRDVLRGQESVHLRPELSEQAEGSEISVQSDSEGDTDAGPHLPQRLHPTEDAGSPAGSKGVHPRTPLRHGTADRADVGTVGARSSSERGEARQPAGELEHRLEQQASRLGHLPTLRDWLLHSLACPGCGSRGFRVCGKPSERMVERETQPEAYEPRKYDPDDPRFATKRNLGGRYQAQLDANPLQTVGWSDCGHNNWRPGTVLDPFIGSGTTCKVARDHQRHAVGIDLNEQYLALAAKRLQQLSLLNA